MDNYNTVSWVLGLFYLQWVVENRERRHSFYMIGFGKKLQRRGHLSFLKDKKEFFHKRKDRLGRGKSTYRAMKARRDMGYLEIREKSM